MTSIRRRTHQNTYKVTFTLLFIIANSFAYTQSSHKLLREGDESYLSEDYSGAEENYRKSLEKKNSIKGNFNLGNSVYQQERYEEAVQHYESTYGQATNDEEKSSALFNLGNAQLKGGNIEPAIESYKNAAILNPNDEDILKNLYVAKLMMKQQQQEQQEQQQQQENQEEQDQENQNQEQQEQQQQQNSEDEQQQSQPQDSDIDNEGEQEQQAPQEQELSKEDALKLLEVIENEEKNVQEKLRKSSGNKKKPAKDW